MASNATVGATGTRRPKPRRRRPPEVLSAAEVAALLEACGDRTATEIRNRALIAVLYRSGLRLSEALSLCPKDVDAAGGAVRVLFGKGGKSRTVGIDPGAMAMVAAWFAARRGWPVPDTAALFCTRRGDAVSNGYIRRLFPALAARAGIAKRVHAHGLRHTHAAELRQEGVDIGIISKQLGHNDISTTARYLDHIAPWAVVEAMRGRKW